MWPFGGNDFHQTTLKQTESRASTAQKKGCRLNVKLLTLALDALPTIELNVGLVRLSLGRSEYGKRTE